MHKFSRLRQDKVIQRRRDISHSTHVPRPDKYPHPTLGEVAIQLTSTKYWTSATHAAIQPAPEQPSKQLGLITKQYSQRSNLRDSEKEYQSRQIQG